MLFPNCVQLGKDVKKPPHAVCHGILKWERREMSVNMDVCFVTGRESQSLLLV